MFANNRYKWLIIILVVVLGAMLLGNNNSNQTASTKVAINKDVQTKCLSEVGDSTFCMFAGTWANVPGYKSVINVSNEAGKSQMLVTIASNGDATMSVTDASNTVTRVVQYHGDSYIQDPTDGKWMKYIGSSTNKPSILDIKAEFLKSDFKSDDGRVINYVNRGLEKVANFTCHKYQIEDPAKTTSTGYLWFDNKDFLLRKLTSSDTTTGTMQITFSYENTSVSLPSPIKGTTLE